MTKPDGRDIYRNPVAIGDLATDTVFTQGGIDTYQVLHQGMSVTSLAYLGVSPPEKHVRHALPKEWEVMVTDEVFKKLNK